MIVKYMEEQDKNFVMSIDKHVKDSGYNKRVYTKTGYIMWEKEAPSGSCIIVFCGTAFPF